MGKNVQHSGTVRVVIAFAVLTGIAFRGSKVLVALYALALGANPLVVGVLAAGYSVFPLVLAVHAGRVTDRTGVRKPLALGSAGLGLGLALPIAFPSLAGLLASVTVLGISHIYYHVAVHDAVGSLGDQSASARNFANFSLGASIAAFIGPAASGFLIDHTGYATTAAVLAAIAVVPALTIGLARHLLPVHVPHPHAAEQKGALDLWKHARLRRALVMSGVVLTGLDLFAFYMPIYGRAIGASASAIGLVLASYAAAAFLVRTVMPRLSRRLGPERLLAAAFLVGAAAYVLFPVFGQVPVLMAIAFVLGLGLGLGQPLTIMMVYERAPPGRSGEALGMRLTVNKVMQIAIPLAFGTLGTAFGVYPVFWANAVFLACAGMLGLRRAERPADKRSTT
jgi:predicted MFS family arabinose efflux permease